MDDILAKKNRHLFLEEKDNTYNSFISNINYAVENIDTIKTFNDNVNNGTVQHLLEAYIEQIGVEGNAWVLRLTELGESILATTSGFNYATVFTATVDINAGATITLPEAMKYRVGTHMLLVSWNGTVCYNGEQYEEVGSFNERSTTIKVKQPIKIGDKLEFRTIALADTASVTLALGDAIDSYPIITNSTNTGRVIAERFSDIANVKDFGAKGDGETDDTAAIQAALNSPCKTVWFPTGTYVVASENLSAQTAVLRSTVSNRTIIGDGIITAQTRVKTLLLVTGKNSVVSIHIDGNDYIGFAITCAGENISVRNCLIHDLNGFENWGGIGIRFYLEDLDTSADISGNRIYNLHAVGDGTASNGAGMSRGIIVQSNHDCTKQIIISDNTIENVGGEEGDAIVLISNLNGVFYNLPALVSGNVITGWSRRAIKVQCNKVSIVGNRLRNPLSETLSSLQRAIDLVVGSDIIVKENTIDTCPYQTQIGGWGDESHLLKNIVVSENTITGLGSETSSSVFAFKYVTNLAVFGNTVLIPDFESLVFNVDTCSDVCVDKNIIKFNGGDTWRNISSCSKILFVENYILGEKGIIGDRIAYSPYPYNTDGFVIGVSNTNRVTLYNSSSTVSNGQTVASIACKQNDSSNPDTVMGTVGFTGEGSIGQVGISFGTANYDSSTSAYVVTEKVRISRSGDTRPCLATQSLGTGTYPWAHVYATTGTVETSDARFKNNVSTVDETLMRAWGKVGFKVFQFIDSVERKGVQSARLHVGVIAQEVQAAFASEGLDAARYGLFCHDEWSEETTTDESGKVSLVLAAGDRFGIRYEEALALECAYQRWLGEQRDAKIEVLMQRISALENNQ